MSLLSSQILWACHSQPVILTTAITKANGMILSGLTLTPDVFIALFYFFSGSQFPQGKGGQPDVQRQIFRYM